MKAQGNHTDFTRSRSGISPEATNRYEYLLHESSQETFWQQTARPYVSVPKPSIHTRSWR